MEGCLRRMSGAVWTFRVRLGMHDDEVLVERCAGGLGMSIGLEIWLLGLLKRWNGLV